jgi:hypothetical protein
MSFGLYSIGFVIVIGGLTYAAYLLHIPTRWIVVGVSVLLGIGILSGVKATRQKDQRIVAKRNRSAPVAGGAPGAQLTSPPVING